MKQLCGLIFSFCMAFHFVAQAQGSYYPNRFLQDLESGQLQNEDLKQDLFAILSLFHNPTAYGGDDIDPNCKVSGCYKHDPVGYKLARRVLFGRIHLQQVNQEYAVEDVYCDRIVRASEFPSRPPGPMQIPNTNILNAEHTWPQSKFTRRHSKGTQKSDLHGLYPVASRVNSSRGNSPFGDVEEIKSQICAASAKGSSTESGRSVFEPPFNHKGNVARALFYFSVRYQMSIDDEQEAYLRLWHVLDPVDEREMERNEIVFETQGNRNPFIDLEELPASIADF